MPNQVSSHSCWSCFFVPWCNCRCGLGWSALFLSQVEEYWPSHLVVCARQIGKLVHINQKLKVDHRSPPPCTKQTPTWLALIFLFFSPRMLALWRRLAVGICVGLIADIVTETNSWPLWWRDILWLKLLRLLKLEDGQPLIIEKLTLNQIHNFCDPRYRQTGFRNYVQNENLLNHVRLPP